MAGRVALLLLMIVAGSGCATTLRDLRLAAPNRTARAVGNYQVLAGCVAEGLQTSVAGSSVGPEDLVYQTVVRPEEQRMTLTGTVSGRQGYPRPLIDLTFRQIDSDNVVIESRWGGYLTGRMAAERIDRQVWPIARRCAGDRLELMPVIAP